MWPLTEETRIGAEQLALGEVATGIPLEFGNWWSRLGGGFVTPAMFWAPDRVDASPRCEHVPFLFWLVDAQRPFTLVELTETPGAPYLALCQAVARLRLPTRCYAISGHVARRDELVGYHDGRYAQFSQILQGRAELLADRFDDGAIDLISIDATQSAAFADGLDAWLPKLSSRAVILIYGIDDPSTNNSAFELWNALSERYRHFEFVQGAGLGVLGVGPDLPPALQHLFSLDAIAPRALEVREMFARLGRSAGLQGELADLRRRLNAALDSDQVAKLESALSADSSFATWSLSSAAFSRRRRSASSPCRPALRPRRANISRTSSARGAIASSENRCCRAGGRSAPTPRMPRPAPCTNSKCR